MPAEVGLSSGVGGGERYDGADGDGPLALLLPRALPRFPPPAARFLLRRRARTPGRRRRLRRRGRTIPSFFCPRLRRPCRRLLAPTRTPASRPALAWRARPGLWRPRRAPSMRRRRRGDAKHREGCRSQTRVLPPFHALGRVNLCVLFAFFVKKFSNDETHDRGNRRKEHPGGGKAGGQ